MGIPITPRWREVLAGVSLRVAACAAAPDYHLATYVPRNHLREIVVDVRQAGIESIVLKTSTRDGDGG